MSTVRIQVRRGTASEWTAANPILAAGEMGVETNTNLFKFGNGTATWTALAYANNSDVAIGEISQDAINTALTMGAGLTKTYNDGANTITITVDTDVVSTKTFATSEATTKASAAQAAAIAAAATDATTKASAAQAAAIAAAATDATTKSAAARDAAEDYTDAAVNTVSNSLSGYLETGDRGTAGGVASLDSNTKILQSELPLNSLTTDISTTGDIFANDIVVSGNLAVNGTMTTINTENFEVQDTLLLMAKGNQSGMLDLGFVVGHNTGVFNHTGFVRDASEDKWKLFKGVTAQPTTTVNFTQGSLDAIAVGRLESTESVLNNPTLTGTVVLPSSSIIGENIAVNAVASSKITDGAITEAKVAANAITEGKIAANSVTNAKIANGAITSDKIAANSIAQSHLGDDSVGTNEISGLAVTTAKIATSAVTADKIATDAVTTEKIATSAVTADEIAGLAVTSAKIAVDAVTTEKIATSAVTTDEIAVLAVTSAKIADGAVLAAKIADLAVNGTKIADGAVDTAKIVDGAITSAKITNETIVNADISPTAAIAQSKIDGLGESLTALAPIASPTFTGTVVLPNTTSIGNLSATELGYLDGITSSVQTQIGTAATALSNHESDTTNIHGIADTSVLATATTVATAKSEAIAAAATDATTKANAAQAAAEATAAAALSGAISTEVSGRNSAIATAKSEAIADATAQVNAVIAAAPAALNTLDELAAALGDDANFAGTITSSVALKAPIASPTFTGTVTVAAAGIAFSDGTQTRAGVPSITEFTGLAAGDVLPLNSQDKFVALTGAQQVTLPATGYSMGQSIDFWQQTGTGASFASTNGVVGTPGLKFRTTNSVVTALKISSGWLVFGDLSA